MATNSQPIDLLEAAAAVAKPQWSLLRRLRVAAAARTATTAESLHAQLQATLALVSWAILIGHAGFYGILLATGLSQLWPLLHATIAAVAGLTMALGLTLAGRAGAAKHLLLGVTTAYVVWVSVRLLGPSYDAQVYLLMLAVIPPLLWTQEQWHYRVGYFVLELGCYLWVTQGLHDPYLIDQLPAWLELELQISTPLGAAATATGLMATYLGHLNRYERALEHQAVLLRAQQQALQQQALHDPLTGLYNRHYMDDAIPRQLARSERLGQALVVVMLDVDFFKRFNDSFGHPCGDDLLRGLASLLQSFLRQGDLVGRFGGEEFLAVLIDTDAKRALPRLEQLRSAVAAMAVEGQGPTRSATISIGVAEYPRDGLTGSALITAADTAMYEAKHAGRNCVRVAASQPGPTASPAQMA